MTHAKQPPAPPPPPLSPADPPACLQADGNLLDASSFAAYTALNTARIPKVRFSVALIGRMSLSFLFLFFCFKIL